MTYLPIEDYGIIGNMRTVALCGVNGSIDWFCTPHFDSPSVFAAILDDDKGGRFQIAPAEDGAAQKQFYWPDTNVLVTRFLDTGGVTEITDYMPVGDSSEAGGLVRQVSVIRGTVTLRMICEPAFNYARTPHTTTITEDGVIFHTDALHLGLATNVALEQTDKGVAATFTLREGETATFVLRQVAPGQGCGLALAEAEADRLFQETEDYWRKWLSKCTYTGRWREQIYRSALAMKLMTFEPTGAIVAAPTTSLPEGIGGERNWDYRYTWIRDAAFTIYAFIRIGFHEEAAAFMEWLRNVCIEERGDDYPLQPFYTIHGTREAVEIDLTHLEGYKGSRPVRIGNDAAHQFQLDLYGEVLDSVYLYNKYGQFITHELWVEMRKLVDWVCANWQRKDVGIWEIRGDPQHFVYSKLMCWVALDRALRIMDKRSLPGDAERWRRTRDAIFEEIMDKGWHEEAQAFVQHYDTDALDAANLMMPLTFFTVANEPRMLSTLEAMMRPLDKGGLASGSMLYRYDVERSPDGLEGDEGTFNMCTFWLVEALTRAGQVERARLIFERLLSNANHLGLFAEQTGARGEALGNYPQAFTHLALISAAVNLDRSLSWR